MRTGRIVNNCYKHANKCVSNIIQFAAPFLRFIYARNACHSLFIFALLASKRMLFKRRKKHGLNEIFLSKNSVTRFACFAWQMYRFNGLLCKLWKIIVTELDNRISGKTWLENVDTTIISNMLLFLIPSQLRQGSWSFIASTHILQSFRALNGQLLPFLTCSLAWWSWRKLQILSPVKRTPNKLLAAIEEPTVRYCSSVSQQINMSCQKPPQCLKDLPHYYIHG